MLEITVKGEEVEITTEQVHEYMEKAGKIAEPFFQLIQDENIRNFARAMWFHAPSYFFVVPASTSGKYHAEWSTEIGGLVRHVLTGVQAAYDLADTFGLTKHQRDLALCAMFGHDILKYGIDFDGRYHDMHPFLPRSYFGYRKSEAYLGDAIAPSEEFHIVMTAIERHMGNIKDGIWTSVEGIKPETPLQQVVHLADYMASRRKFVLTDFVSGYEY